MLDYSTVSSRRRRLLILHIEGTTTLPALILVAAIMHSVYPRHARGSTRPAAASDNFPMRAALFIVSIALLTASSFANITDDNCNGVLHGVATNEQQQTVSGLTLVLFPLFDVDYVLPTTKTGEHGEYRFDHVCDGRFTVLIQDQQAGYPIPYWYLWLGKYQDVKLAAHRQTAIVNVYVPPKGGQLLLTVRRRDTREVIRTAEVKFKFVNHRNLGWIRFNPLDGEKITLPANTELMCRVQAKGFHTWIDGERKGMRIKLAPEETLALEAEVGK